MLEDWLIYSRIVLEPSYIRLSLLKSKDRRMPVYDLDSVLDWLNFDFISYIDESLPYPKFDFMSDDKEFVGTIHGISYDFVSMDDPVKDKPSKPKLSVDELTQEVLDLY